MLVLVALSRGVSRVSCMSPGEAVTSGLALTLGLCSVSWLLWVSDRPPRPGGSRRPVGRAAAWGVPPALWAVSIGGCGEAAAGHLARGRGVVDGDRV